ncbi:chemotaxis protein CheW [Vreelandella salicampi]|uniref:Chemotaxis protein CheW n=1 Tax=Vreelandella salicampi TaxID=1449798 RepID=A0A7Z0LMV5_9GAMM|nr:chemotaxis protein CheW [Halomonas salicampi]NYS61804.1 chemotaxis protein CheW [Halomonas salicampi]
MTHDAPLSLTEALTPNATRNDTIEREEPTQQFVLFRLEGRRFALPGHAVTEILGGEQPVYPLPGLPASTEGVIHLRGQIESVVYLHALLGMTPPSSPFASQMILMVNAAGLTSGVRVDQLDDVCDIAQSALKTPPDSLSEALRPYVTALFQYRESAPSDSADHDAVALLDASALFTAYQNGLG